MLTYETYLLQKQALDEKIHATKVMESDKVKAIEEERQQRNSILFEEFQEKKRRNNQDYSDKILAARQQFIAERRRIFEESNILSMEWKGQLLKIESGEITREQIYGVTSPAPVRKEASHE